MTHFGKTSVSNLEREKMAQLYLDGFSSCIIGKRLGRASNCVAKHLKSMGIVLRGHRYRTNAILVNEDYFKFIDTPTKSYLMGMIYSDGNVYKDRFQLRLQEKDRYLLEHISKEIGYMGEIRTEYRNKTNTNHQDMATLSVNRKSFVQHLKNKGVIPNKTNKLVFPSFIGEENLIHFIHGLFDGDGSIRIDERPSKYNSTDLVCRLYIAGCYKLLEGVKDFFDKRGIDGSLYINNVNPLSGRLVYSNTKALQFANMIYRNRQPIFLQRKFDTYIKMVKMLFNNMDRRSEFTKRIIQEGLLIVT